MANKYKMTRKDNGKYVIEKVPIFKLGNIRGFDYNQEWGDKLLANMKKLQGSGYQAPLIIGHGGGWNGEKEAKGFLNGFLIESGTVYCNLDDIDEYTATQDIAKQRFPYRSVEVHNDDAMISALALLGATEPYFKFPKLEVFSQQGFGSGEAVLFEESGAQYECAQEEKPSWVGTLVKEIKEMFNGSGGKPPTTTETENKTEPVGGKMDREEYKAKFGCYPEEAADYKQKYEAQQAELARLAAENAEKDKQAFASNMQAMNVAPAATEMMQACIAGATDKRAAAEAFGKLMNFAKEGKLFIPAGESSEHADKKPVSDFDTAEGQKAIVARIHKYMADHNCDFEAASKAIYAEIEDADNQEGK